MVDFGSESLLVKESGVTLMSKFYGALLLLALTAFSAPVSANPFGQYQEGQVLKGSDGKTYVVVGGVPREQVSQREDCPYCEAPLGRGPHVLLISKRDGAMTQMNYKSGEACRVARDAVRKQVEPPPGAIRPIVGGEPPLTAVCVPQ